MENDLRNLIARLIAHRVLPREDTIVRRMLTDEAFRQELDSRLAACGLRLLENPYAAHVAVGLKQEVEEPVFGKSDSWLSNNLGLGRDAIALLVVVWALIILPKRERQIKRFEQDSDMSQAEMFAEAKPIAHGAEVSAGIPEVTLLADFGAKLGGKMRLNTNLGMLARLGFVERRNKVIYEGPLLDLAIDYGVLAPRIIDGALADLFSARGEQDVEVQDTISTEQEIQTEE